MRTLIFGLLLSLAAAAQQAGPPQNATATAADSAPGSISGLVLRAGDNTALRKALLSLIIQQPATGPVRPVSTSSDAEGRFSFADLKPGRYMLSVGRTGYVRQMYGQRAPNGPGSTLTVGPGQRVTDIVIRLTPGGVVTGRVVDEDGESLSNVRVQALRWTYMNGRRELVPSGGSQTDDRGEYRMFGLAPGRYYISAVYNAAAGMGGWLDGGDGGQEAYAPTYYPGVNDPMQAAPIDVRPGDEIPGISLRLVPGRAVRVSGRVRNPAGEAARSISINLFPKGAGMFRGDQKYAASDEQGNFEIRGVMPGSYTALANSMFEGKRVQARADVEVGASDVDAVLLALRPGTEIPGQVRLDTGADLTNAHLRVYLSPKEFGVMMGGGGPGEVKSDFSFNLSDVSDGDYNVRVSGLPEDLYVRSIRMGARDVLNDGLNIRGRGSLLEIAIGAGAGRLEGKVSDDHDQPFTGARVLLVPDDARRNRPDLLRSGTTDQYGRFSIRGIPPGRYTAFAWESLDPGAEQDPEFLRTYQNLGVSVEINSASQPSQDLKIIPAARSGS